MKNRVPCSPNTQLQCGDTDVKLFQQKCDACCFKGFLSEQQEIENFWLKLEIATQWLAQVTQVERIHLDLLFKWTGSRDSHKRYCLPGVSWAELLPLRVAAPQITTSLPLSVILITRLLPLPHCLWAAVFLRLLQLSGCPWTMLQCTVNALANLICLWLAYCL